ncbi:hypothetical protein CLAFUW4_13558 [Fulvia fulva]|uniref:Uncharacterized protein n=1 Tax=Passalora fulva TaxID=5499 RepID=A0A9Q8UVQ9_PASFU|nr:uncharacterized protein CLAFUR5_13409 [Fulvia fulva]KAK4610427.1 hypothetical protein CLAFUR4_13560 [Fulvia fulva]KAK4611474.1 hypothetical protein CLAFUR0_13569 [Fulvia fulva]UJO24249.1 hypothetical protein CLAFUR5_13409 [Fulvia fulva]WPV21878.1 hypothetical protein CLAFUW4_13558 [Fulvia fulva]WPV36929.1 hypothetical protein CLAFUW7_13565 [Fulvia fulva]
MLNSSLRNPAPACWSKSLCSESTAKRYAPSGRNDRKSAEESRLKELEEHESASTRPDTPKSKKTAGPRSVVRGKKEAFAESVKPEAGPKKRKREEQAPNADKSKKPKQAPVLGCQYGFWKDARKVQFKRIRAAGSGQDPQLAEGSRQG